MTPMLYTVYGFAVFLLLFWCCLWLLHITALVYGKWRLHKKSEPPDPELQEKEVEGVSIIKPLCQRDDNLVHNLETFFSLNYPKYELLFCIQEVEDSQNYILVQKLIESHPGVDVRVFQGGEEVGVNPKINNMTPAYRAAKYPLVLVSDSGIKMKEDTLCDMVSSMKERVGIVHQMPFSCDRTGLPSILEKVYFGTSHARIYLTANMLGINCATGMSALMRKQLLDNVGGFPAFGCYLAEDFFFAQSVLDQGYDVVISSQPAWQNSGTSSITYFHNRMSRWAKLRAAMCPHTILLEPISECMVSGGLAAWAAYLLLRTDPLVFYLVHILVWFLSDWTLIHVVQNGTLPFNKFEFLVMWLFREVAAPYIFLHAILNPAIRWRNFEFRLKWGGKAEAVLAPRQQQQQEEEPLHSGRQTGGCCKSPCGRLCSRTGSAGSPLPLTPPLSPASTTTVSLSSALKDSGGGGRSGGDSSMLLLSSSNNNNNNHHHHPVSSSSSLATALSAPHPCTTTVTAHSSTVGANRRCLPHSGACVNLLLPLPVKSVI